MNSMMTLTYCRPYRNACMPAIRQLFLPAKQQLQSVESSIF
jgi:hypothetical protein